MFRDARLIAAGTLCITIGVALGVLGAEAHPGHPQKKLADYHWYHQLSGGNYDAWMTITTSSFFLMCGSGPQDCGSRWNTPLQESINDWNSRTTTVTFDVRQSDDHDLHVYIVDLIYGNPSIGGLAVTFINCVPISWPPVSDQDWHCFVAYADAVGADKAHWGVYGTRESRRATMAHEFGHVISLRHESVNANETQLYPCRQDDTGPIPPSIMSYNCIDPQEVGGQGIFEVQPWDVCGVNHAYHDPTIGFASCDNLMATPTPTPTPMPPYMGSTVWGDVDCDLNLSIGDALKTARHLIGLPILQAQDCPPLGVPEFVNTISRMWGDVDCDGSVVIGDALKTARHLIGLSVSQQPGCLALGSPIVTGTTPAPAPTPSPSPTPAPTPTPTSAPSPASSPTS